MSERFKLSLGQIWILISAFCLALPVFMPSSADPQHFFENTMGTVTVLMFILSFPMSILGLPAMLLTCAALNVDFRSVEGMYLNLTMMFFFGAAQWFWVMPRVVFRYPQLQTLGLLSTGPEVVLAEARGKSCKDFYDARGRTPIERVIQYDDDESINPS